MTNDDNEQARRDQAQNDLARWCLSVLTMRSETADGEWLEGDFEEIYRSGWREAQDALGDDEAAEFAFLNMLNMAELLLSWLSDLAKNDPAYWLTMLSEFYVETRDDDDQK